MSQASDIQTSTKSAPDRYKWEVLGVVMVGTLMSALDSSIVNVSLPNIMADFGASLDDIEWVITGYMLSFATLMPLTSWMRDRIGHRTLYIASLFIFTIGSLLCGVAWNLPSLVGARVIQALGGGALTPVGMAMISEVFAPHERGRALGYWGIGVIVGPALGPTIGGYLTHSWGWRYIFLVNLPIGLVGIIWSRMVLRRDKPHASLSKPFDISGFIFLSAFLIAFLLGLSKGEKEGWMSDFILTCWAISILGLIGFITIELIKPDGIMDLRLFKSSVFTSCIVVTAVRSVALYGGTFLLPVFLQQQMGLDEIETGLILLPGALVIGLFMPISGRMNDRSGPRIPSIIGLIAVAYFMYMYRMLDENTSIWNVIMPTLIRGFGIGLLVTPVMASAMNAVPPQKAGMCSAMINLVQQVSGSMGIAVLGAILSRRTHFHLGVMGSNVSSNSPVFQNLFRDLSQRAHLLGYSHHNAARVAQQLLGKHVGAAASVGGFNDAFLAGAVIVIAGIAFAVFLPGESVKVDAEHAVME